MLKTGSADEVAALIAACDRHFGNKPGLSGDEIGNLLADADLAHGLREGSALIAVAIVSSGEAVVRVSPARHGLGIGAGLAAMVEAAMPSDGGAQWVPHDDAAAHDLLSARGWRCAATDVQMRRELPEPVPVPLPDGFVVRSATDADLPAINALICDAWSIQPPWAELRARLIDVPGYDPGRWLLALDTDTLAAVVVGDRDAHVRHLAVGQAYRRAGLGSGMLSLLLERLAGDGHSHATLGVYLGNVSGAHTLYTQLGWIETARADRWVYGFQAA